ncbi:MAG: hypothetical protein RR052_00445 [Oscillospiraceae bacterium]
MNSDNMDISTTTKSETMAVADTETTLENNSVTAKKVQNNVQNKNSPIRSLPVQTPRPRRVGTFTMGLSLIASGLVFLSILLFDLKVEQILFIIKFSPLILISLGIEVLVYNIGFKYEKVKYDFVSMLVCLGLIGVFGVITMFALYVQQATLHGAHIYW